MPIKSQSQIARHAEKLIRGVAEIIALDPQRLGDNYEIAVRSRAMNALMGTGDDILISLSTAQPTQQQQQKKKPGPKSKAEKMAAASATA